MRPTELSRRVLVSAFVLSTALGLTSCGTAEGPAAAGSSAPALSDEDVTLRLTWWGADARTARTQEAIEAFEAQHPTIDVVGEFSDWSGYWDKLATSTAGGNSPDVIQMDQLYLASYADRGVLADLGSLPQLDTSNLEASVLDTGRSGETLYGMPASTTAFAILVNQDLLDELGLALPDTTTWTWDDLTAFAQQVRAKSGGSIAGISPWNNEYSLRLAARQAGEELFTDGEVTISPETLAAYFQRSLDWVKNGAAQSASQFSEQASVAIDQSDFSTGKQAMTFTQVTQISAYAAATGGAKLTAVPIPAGDAGAEPYFYLKPGMYWTVSAQSEHPAEAALLVDFLVNSEEAATAIGTERGIPANPSVREFIAGTLTPEEKQAVDFVDTASENLGDAPQIVPNGASELDKIIQRYLLEVLFERQTPQAAAEAFISEVQSSIDAAS
ncbi:ABC transporter substrate-binding protein [Kineococcus glutinatus]|uniref:Extracellular solute-binding protein n=1 Tax=Kineococcus glutinatus TaxID=1070872 RepID=A0ABP9I6G6_9ACTN